MLISYLAIYNEVSFEEAKNVGRIWVPRSKKYINFLFYANNKMLISVDLVV